MNSTRTQILSALTGLALLGSFAHGAVVSLVQGPVVSGEFTSANEDSQTGTNYTYNFSYSTLTASNSLLVVGVNWQTTDDIPGLSFNGQNFTRLGQSAADGDTRGNEIWALDLGNETASASTIDLTVDDGGNQSVNMYVYQLSNATLVDAKFNSDLNAGGTLSADLTDVAAGSFIVDFGLIDDSGTSIVASGDTRTSTTSVVDMTQFSTLSSYISGSDWTTSGTADLNYITDARSVMSSAAFAAIPEPSTFALLGIAGLALALGMRKRLR